MESIKPSRYAHTEGHTDICYSDDGSHIVTCGQDGEVRVWANEHDAMEDFDDPTSHRFGEQVFSVALKNGKLYTASDSNTVQCSSFPNGAPDGIVTRFTSPATHLTFNKTGSLMVAGASDFTIKCVEIDGATHHTFRGHQAPILSVALDPNEEYIASSSCDGSVKVWKVADQLCAKTLTEILPKSNDFSASKCLCRIAWHPDTRKLYVPCGNAVNVYECETWNKIDTYTDSQISKTVNIATVSPCGLYLAVACIDGLILVWNLKTASICTSYKHEKGLGITALVWNPVVNHGLAYSDSQGSIGLLKNTHNDNEGNDNVPDSKTDKISDEYADLFDDGEDDDLLAASGQVANGNISDDDLPEIVHKKRQTVLPIADENSMDTDSIPRKQPMSDDDDDDAKSTATSTTAPPRVIYKAPEVTPLQTPFQPGSTPVHLSNRFMLWNDIGVIRQYNTEEENSIDVEFHDTATHHALHIDNSSSNYTMACLTDQAVVLACRHYDDDHTSRMVCMHYGSWDSCKEWSVVMPQSEVIQVITAGDTWIAIATDRRNIRLFTIGGLQRDIISIPGPVVTMAAHNNQLMIVYHTSAGIAGDQCLGVQLYNMTSRRRKLINGEQLPLSPKSTLSWLGFSAEGSPVTLDSSGIVRLYNRGFGPSWAPVANFRNHAKGKSDHFWLISVYENAQQLRCIPCKGSTYPATLPRPAVSIMTFELPVCDKGTEKGTFEETYLRLKALSSYMDFWSSQGLSMTDEDKEDIVRPQKEALMKMFALACKCERDVRAVEICELMPDESTVQLAIKYASRIGRMQLAERISEVAQRMSEEVNQDDDDDEDNYETSTHWSKVNRQNNEDNVSDEDMDEENEDQMEEVISGPMLTLGAKVEKVPVRPVISSSGSRKNPFKVGSQKMTPTNIKGSSVFDGMGRKVKRSGGANKSPEVVIKPKKIIKKQGKILLTKSKSENQSTNKVVTSEPNMENTENITKTYSAFEVWREANKDKIESCEGEESDLIKIGAQMFRELPKEERMKWTEKAKLMNESTDDGGSERKRKRDETDEGNIEIKNKSEADINIAKKKRPLSQTTNSKLSAFKKD